MLAASRRPYAHAQEEPLASVLGHLVSFLPPAVQTCFAREGGPALKEKGAGVLRSERFLPGQNKSRLLHWFGPVPGGRPSSASTIPTGAKTLVLTTKVRLIGPYSLTS